MDFNRIEEIEKLKEVLRLSEILYNERVKIVEELIECLNSSEYIIQEQEIKFMNAANELNSIDVCKKHKQLNLYFRLYNDKIIKNSK
jgi:cellulose synthase/poly-beta-1,6-N-acetylglucosamine synthase-like glycosyltransferase